MGWDIVEAQPSPLSHCAACLRQFNKTCAGKCPCPIDGQDIREVHFKEGYCPLMRFTTAMKLPSCSSCGGKSGVNSTGSPAEAEEFLANG